MSQNDSLVQVSQNDSLVQVSQNDKPVQAFLGLGGNIGQPQLAMARALSALEVRGDTKVLAVSSVYQTPPWGPIAQDDFLNAVALCETVLSPQDLLAACLATEQSLKRVRRERWGPRTIDIDVLIYGDAVIETENLTIPHPRMTERAFVMVPFAEIAPGFICQQKSALAWANALDQNDITKIRQSADWWRL